MPLVLFLRRSVEILLRTCFMISGLAFLCVIWAVWWTLLRDFIAWLGSY